MTETTQIAIVAAGDVARYFIEQFTGSTNEIVLLTRSSPKFPCDSRLDVRITVDSLLSNLSDCDTVLSTLSGPEEVFTSAQLAILEGWIQSTKCKTFIPSGWTINTEDFPDQPLHLSESRRTVLEALRAQRTIQWTVICNGWFMEYISSTQQRYLKDIGKEWLMDHHGKVFDLYGDGLQKITLTSAQDVARATIALLEAENATWSEFTHSEGQTLTSHDLFSIITKYDASWKIQRVTLTDVLKDVLAAMNTGQNLEVGALRLLSFTNCARCPLGKALQWGKRELGGIHPCGVEMLLKKAASTRLP